jgi:hypothetical protein
MLNNPHWLGGLGLAFAALAFYFSWYRWPPYKAGPKWQSVVIVVLYLSAIILLLGSNHVSPR